MIPLRNVKITYKDFTKGATRVAPVTGDWRTYSFLPYGICYVEHNVMSFEKYKPRNHTILWIFGTQCAI